MPLRINTGTLSDLIQRGGAQQAQAQAQNWARVGQGPAEFLGGLRALEDEQRERVYRQHQDEYYRSQQAATEERTASAKRAEEVANIGFAYYETALRDPDKAQTAMELARADGAKPDVLRWMTAEGDKRSARESNEVNQLAQERELQTGWLRDSSRTLQSWVNAAGMNGAAAYTGGGRQALYAAGLDHNIPQEKLDQFLPEAWNPEVLQQTAILGADQAQLNTLREFAEAQRARNLGFSRFDPDPVVRQEQERTLGAEITSRLAVADSVDEVKVIWEDLGGTPQNEWGTRPVGRAAQERWAENIKERRVPESFLERFKEYSPENFLLRPRETWKAALKEERSLYMTQAELDVEETLMLHGKDSIEGQRALEVRRAITAASRRVDGSEKPEPIKAVDLDDYYENLDAIDARTWTGEIEEQPFRREATGVWTAYDVVSQEADWYVDREGVTHPNRVEVAAPDQEDDEEIEWLTAEQAEAAKVEEMSRARRNKNMLTPDEEMTMYAKAERAIQDEIARDLKAGKSLEETDLSNIGWRGKESWTQAWEAWQQAGKGNDGTWAEPPTIPIPSQVLSAYLRQAGEDNRAWFKRLMMTDASLDRALRTIHTFRNPE